MKKEASLIIDIGTGSSRVAIVSDTFEIINIKSMTNTYYVDEKYNDAKYFIPEELKNNILLMITEVLESLENYSIRYISSAAARESIILLDNDGKDFLGLPNIDNRGKEWLSHIKNREYIEKVSGRPLTEDFGAMKLYGLRKKRPQQFNAVHKVISLSDWIGYIFTENIEMEYSQACETQLFNIYDKTWDEHLCKDFSIDRKILPNIISTGTIHGLTNEIKQQIGLSQDCVYIVGGADTQLAAKGMGLGVNDIGLISGTSSPIVKYKDSIPDYEKNKDFNFWCSCNLSGEGYQIETNPGVTGLNLQLAKDSLLPTTSYEEIDHYIKKNINHIKCIASFTTQSPYKNVSFSNGGFLLPVPFNQKLDTKDFIFSIVVDIAFAIAFKIQQNEVLSQTVSSYIIGSGGGLRLTSLCQMIADLTGKKLILKENFDEASIIGCAKVCFSKDKQAEGKDIKNVKEYIPEENYYLHEKLEEWLLYKEKINSKKKIGAFE